MVKAIAVEAFLAIGGQVLWGCVKLHWGHVLWVVRVCWCLNETVDNAAVSVVRSVHPFSLAF